MTCPNVIPPWKSRLNCKCVECKASRSEGSRKANANRLAPEPDEIAVERLVSGLTPDFTVKAERIQATRELLRLGFSSPEIARRLGIGLRTVERYRRELRERVPLV